MAVLRLKSHWHDDERQRSIEEVAGAIGFNGWKLALDKAKTLHGEDFFFRDDRQRLAVITEYLVFQIQIVHRLIHDQLSPQDEVDLIAALAHKMADFMQDNGNDLLGPGDHANDFIATLNRRAAEYADTGFSDDGPAYSFYRHLGASIQGVMGTAGENRWVIDQVMDVDGPEVFGHVQRTTGSLLG